MRLRKMWRPVFTVFYHALFFTCEAQRQQIEVMIPSGLDWRDQHDWLMDASKNYEIDGNYPMALDHSRRAFDLQSHRQDTLLNTARLHGVQGEHKEALELLKFAHTLTPRSRTVSEAFAFGLQRAGHHKAASTRFRTILEYNTDDPTILLSLATSLGELRPNKQNYHLAKTHLIPALQLITPP
jgi:tetratricopeptide (TPR) repeat protein